MAKKIIRVVIIIVVLLAGVGFALWKYAYAVTDYSKKYKDFFDYTFDGDYTIELVTENDDEYLGHKTWSIDYTDANGVKRIGEITSRNNLYKRSSDSYDEWDLANFVQSEQQKIVDSQVFEDLFAEHYSCTRSYEGYATIYEDNNYRISIYAQNVLLETALTDIQDASNITKRTIKNAVDSKTGIKLSQVTAQEFLKQEKNGIVINVELSDEIKDKTDENFAKCKDILSELKTYVGSDVNYEFTFSIFNTNSKESTLLYKQILVNNEVKFEDENFEKGIDVNSDQNLTKYLRFSNN